MTTTLKKTDFEGVQLDLAFVSERVAIMGNPFQNDHLAVVRRFLDTKFQGKYKVFNLSDEDDYNIEQDIEHVHNIPFQEGTPCCLDRIVSAMASIEAYLVQNLDTNVVFHCKSGQGRSGLFAACLILHLGIVKSATDAVIQTNAGRGQGCLTIPSQIRYLHYYERLLRVERVPMQSLQIHTIRMNTVPRCNSSILNAGSSPRISVFRWGKDPDDHWVSEMLYDQAKDDIPHNRVVQLKHNIDKSAEVELNSKDMVVRGDVCVVIHSEQEKIAQFFLHSSFVEKNYLYFEKTHIDIANEDKHHRIYDKDFSVEILFQKVPDQEGFSRVSYDQYHHSDDLSSGEFPFNLPNTVISE